MQIMFVHIYYNKQILDALGVHQLQSAWILLLLEPK